MAIYSDEEIGIDKLSTYNYAISIKALLSGNKGGFDLSPYLKNLSIRINREDFVMPLFQIKCSIPPEQLQAIQNDDGVQFKVSASYLSTNDASSAGANGYDEYFPDVLLTPLMVSKQPINVKDLVVNSSDTTTNYPYETLEIAAVPSYALKLNKKIYSGVYQNTNITNVILAMVSQYNNLSVSLYEDINSTKYDQIILTPGNIFKNIKYINENYGIFPYKLSTFITNETLEIYPLGIPITNNQRDSNRGNLNLNIRFPVDSGDSASKTSGSAKIINIEDNNFSNILAIDTISSISIQNYDSLYGELFGNDNRYLMDNILGGRSVSSMEEQDSSTNSMYKRKLYDNIRNNTMSQNFNEKSYHSTTKIVYNFSNIAMNYLDVNKNVSFFLDNPNYNQEYDGNYYISNANFNFATSGNSNAATLSGNLLLLKSLK